MKNLTKEQAVELIYTGTENLQNRGFKNLFNNGETISSIFALLINAFIDKTQTTYKHMLSENITKIGNRNLSVSLSDLVTIKFNDTFKHDVILFMTIRRHNSGKMYFKYDLRYLKEDPFEGNQLFTIEEIMVEDTNKVEAIDVRNALTKIDYRYSSDFIDGEEFYKKLVFEFRCKFPKIKGIH